MKNVITALLLLTSTAVQAENVTCSPLAVSAFQPGGEGVATLTLTNGRSISAFSSKLTAQQAAHAVAQATNKLPVVSEYWHGTSRYFVPRACTSHSALLY